MTWVLDTDTCIYLLREQLPELTERLRNMDPAHLGITSITVAELAYGALHSSHPEANFTRVNQFLAPFRVLDFDISAALRFAALKQYLVSTGQQIGPMDMLIAAIALAAGAILVTNNQREFSRVPELQVENWVTSVHSKEPVMQPPEIIKPTKLADYLEVISKAVFESGMRWSVVEAKWDGFRDAFHGFDPEYIANLTPTDVDALAADTRIIRNRRKIEATIHNANVLLTLDQRHGGFANYLASFPDFESASARLRQELKHFGAFGTYYFLYVVGQPVPPHEEFRAKLAALK